MFIDVELAHPGCFEVEDELVWWRRDAIAMRTYQAQARLVDEPKWLHSFAHLDGAVYDGMSVTLRALWARRGNLAQQLSVIKAGILFTIRDSSRGTMVPQCYPKYNELIEIKSSLHALAGITESPWWHNHTQVVPDVSNMELLYPMAYNLEFRSASRFLFELDKLAASVLAEWQPVRLCYAKDRYSLAKVLNKFNASPEKIAADREERKNAERWRVADEQFTAERQAKAQAAQQMKEKHPRYGDWPVRLDELKELVWSNTMTVLADLFGVSDTAIRRYCDRHGVPRPPQGYWLVKK